MKITKEIINEKRTKANEEFDALKNNGNYEQHTTDKMAVLIGKLKAYNEMLLILTIQ